jgi:hypothetical protein
MYFVDILNVLVNYASPAPNAARAEEVFSRWCR